MQHLSALLCIKCGSYLVSVLQTEQHDGLVTWRSGGGKTPYKYLL